jgi:Flp pilus assembly protein TadG
MRQSASVVCGHNADRRKIRARGEERRGTAAIEFAVLATLLVTLTLGVAELSRGIRAKAVLIDAARTGCRAGALPGASNSDVTTDLNSILTDNGLTVSNATVTIMYAPAPSNGNAPSWVTGKDITNAKQNYLISVTVSYPVSKVFTRTLFLSTSGNFTETVIMMRQG